MLGFSEKLPPLVALAAVTLALGCKPKIGDDCQLSTDCAAAGDRLCDITSPGGYCTIYNCEPGSCPEDESLCVQFGWQRSALADCADPQSPSPYARSFCMATCKGDGDCRDGYACQDLSSSDNAWGALLIDRDRGNRACLVAVAAADAAGGAGPGNQPSSNVCRAQLPGEDGG